MNFEKNSSSPNETVTDEHLSNYFAALAQDLSIEGHRAVHQNISVSPELLEKIKDLSETPFRDIYDAYISYSPASFDKEDGVIYPQTIAANFSGWYGDIDVNERTISLVIAAETIDQPVRGFILQNFHDAESYELQQMVGQENYHGLQTTAGNYETFQESLQDTESIRSVGRDGDYKRTAEFRPLDYRDLELLVHLAEGARQTNATPL